MLAQDDLFKTNQSFGAPFIDLSVPFSVVQDKFSVVSVVFLVDFLDVVLVVEVTSIDLFC